MRRAWRGRFFFAGRKTAPGDGTSPCPDDCAKLRSRWETKAKFPRLLGSILSRSPPSCGVSGASGGAQGENPLVAIFSFAPVAPRFRGKRRWAKTTPSICPPPAPLARLRVGGYLGQGVPVPGSPVAYICSR